MKKVTFLFWLLIPVMCNAQVSDNEVELTACVKEIDSQYILIPQFKVSPKLLGVKIHKRLSFGNENSDSDCKFYIQKLIGSFYINLYRINFSQPLINDDFELTKEFTSNNSLSDSIDLDTYIPLEPGEYRIYIELAYYIKDEKKSVISDFTEFLVTHRPKRSISFPPKINGAAN